MNKTDYIIVGAGIVGLATALKLLEAKPNSKIIILEKESELGKHQTGNNSGVIHSGIYYKPGSLKAKNCIVGYNQLLHFCNKNDVEYKLLGKLIVATDEKEEKSLEDIYKRGIENDLSGIEIIDKNKLKKLEPSVNGIIAINVPQTGIVDFKKVLKKYAEIISKKAEIIFNSEVVGIKEKKDSIEIKTRSSIYETENLITCAGLKSDKLAKLTQPNLSTKIIPFRGEYYKLKPEKNKIVNKLIYPVPDPSFPFLGVHFTPKINGDLEAGPNAVFSFKREGYKKNSFSLNDTIESLTFSGFQKIAGKYWKTGFGEFYRSYSKSAFTKALNKLVPEIKKDDLIEGGAGVRAQACDESGNLIDDFQFVKSEKILHVVNASSPAATASLAIGEHIVNLVLN